MKCLCARTRRAARSLTRLYEEHLRAVELTPPQFGLLSVLAERAGLAQTELVEALDLDQTTLSRNLKLLIANKWVKRGRSAEDRRQAVYSITAAGLEVRRAALPHWQRAQAQMRRTLGAEFDAALALLERVAMAAAA
jgi:DNA-binding MarR family transcriptional regulator